MRNKFNGFFKDWIFEYYRIASPDRKYSLWVCNGFSSFRDDVNTTPKSLINDLGFWDRLKLWKEYKREKMRRLMNLAGSRDCKEFISNLK
jgi:hypothetical protein